MQLEDEIRRLHHNEKIKPKVLSNDTFIDQPQYLELKKTFRLSKYHDEGWKWQQLVRTILEPSEVRQYMYDKLLHLLLKHRRTHEDYFTLKTQEGTFQIPNPLADLNKLEILYIKYFEIYRKITERIHFDYPKIEYSGPIIKGKINWTKTIRTSPTKFPSHFVTSIQQKEFETSENILLVLCAEWMYRESNRLLHIQYDEPLTDYQKNLLRIIIQKTQLILNNFPLPNVLNESKRYWGLSFNDSRIRTLEEKSKNRIREKLIRNQNYSDLLDWIRDFRELDITRVTEKTPTKHILDSIKNLDTVYELWIFLEFVEFLFERGILVNFQLGRFTEPKCEFDYNGKIITLWYERGFKPGGPHAWVAEHYPDFTATIDDEILGVFDAKNYAKSSSISDTINKMLSYMNNLDSGFGCLIYPNHPENWNDLERDKKIEKIKEMLKNGNLSEAEIGSRAKQLSKLSWDELPSEYKKKRLTPRAFDKFEQSRKDSRFHHEQMLCLLRMQPQPTNEAIKWKNESLTLMLNSIISRIPLITKAEQ